MEQANEWDEQLGGGEGVGSMENSQACYLGIWTHAPYPFLPQKILSSRSFQAILSTIFLW